MFGDVVERKPVTLSFAKKTLARVKDRNYEQKLAKEYVDKFSKLNWGETEDLMKAIEKAEIPRLKEKHVVKLIDILPQTADELKVLLAKETVTLSKEDAKKLLKVIKKHR